MVFVGIRGTAGRAEELLGAHMTKVSEAHPRLSTRSFVGSNVCPRLRRCMLSDPSDPNMHLWRECWRGSAIFADATRSGQRWCVLCER